MVILQQHGGSMNKLSSDENWRIVAARLKQQTAHLTHDEATVEQSTKAKMSAKVRKNLEKIRGRISRLFFKI
jgi:hypothetical protein